MRLAFIFFLGFILIGGLAHAAVRGDFNDVNGPSLDDVAILLARLDMGNSATISQVQARALEIYNSTQTPVTRIPSPTIDDINGNEILDLEDVALFLAWLDMGPSAVGQNIEARAKEIYPSLIGKFSIPPGLEIGSSSTTLGITGVQPD